MARSDLYIDPNPRAGHSFIHKDILFRYVATCRSSQVAFYCDIAATKGIAVYPSGRKSNVQNPCTTHTPNSKGYDGRRKQWYRYFRYAFGHSNSLLAAHASYIAEHGELISEGMTTDHKDGITTNNHPSNIRLLSLSENSRQGDFMKGLRNKGINPMCFPLEMRDRYCARMTAFLATHTQYQRSQLTRDDLLSILTDDKFEIVNGFVQMEKETKQHCEI